jgi:hypothetical protein
MDSLDVSDAEILEDENSDSHVQSFVGQSISESVNLSELGLGQAGGDNGDDDDDLDYSMTFEEDAAPGHDAKVWNMICLCVVYLPLPLTLNPTPNP